MLIENEILNREMRMLRDQANTLRNKVTCHQNNELTQKQIIEKLRSHNESLKVEIKSLRTRIEEIGYERDRKQAQFEFVIRRIQEELEVKNNQYAKLESKIMPLFDTDAVRLKVLNELEYPHKLELEEKDAIIDRLKQQTFDYRRQIQYLKCQIETEKIEHERATRDLKSKHKNEISNALLDLHTYEALEYTRKSNSQMQTLLKKDLQYYKQRYFKTEQDLHSARSNLDQVKIQLHARISELIQEVGKLTDENRQLRERLSS